MWPFSKQRDTGNLRLSLSDSLQQVVSKERVWPPEEHEARLARYGRYRRMFLGDHWSVFHDPLRGADHDLFAQYYVTINLAAQVSHTAADILFGEPPRFLATDVAFQPLVDRIAEENDLASQLPQAARGQSYRGDAVFKVRYEDQRVIIAPLPPETFFPIFNPEDPSKVDGVWVAWVRKTGDGSRGRGQEAEILRVEVHTPGQIQNLALPYKNGRLGSPLNLQHIEPNTPEFVATGISEIPIVHIPNLQTDDSGPFGISDYAFFESIQRELNNRMSQIGGVLDKHADPNMVIPSGALDPEGNFRTVTQKAWPIEQGDATPQYVTWDGKLDASFRQMEMLQDLFFMTAGLSPATLGFSRPGFTSADSGRAIYLRQLRTLRWVQNKRAPWTRGLARLFCIAQEFLAAHHPDHRGLEPTDVQVLWRDGLPTDRSADIEDAARGISGRVLSLEQAVRLAQGLEGDNLMREVEAIRNDRPA